MRWYWRWGSRSPPRTPAAPTRLPHRSCPARRRWAPKSLPGSRSPQDTLRWYWRRGSRSPPRTPAAPSRPPRRSCPRHRRWAPKRRLRSTSRRGTAPASRWRGKSTRQGTPAGRWRWGTASPRGTTAARRAPPARTTSAAPGRAPGYPGEGSRSPPRRAPRRSNPQGSRRSRCSSAARTRWRGSTTQLGTEAGRCRRRRGRRCLRGSRARAPRPPGSMCPGRKAAAWRRCCRRSPRRTALARCCPPGSSRPRRRTAGSCPARRRSRLRRRRPRRRRPTRRWRGTHRDGRASTSCRMGRAHSPTHCRSPAGSSTRPR